MRETLRLNPTGKPMSFQLVRASLRSPWLAPLIGAKSRENTVIGGKYPVLVGNTIGVNTLCIHRDPEVWGEDVRCMKTQYSVLRLTVC